MQDTLARDIDTQPLMAGSGKNFHCLADGLCHNGEKELSQK